MRRVLAALAFVGAGLAAVPAWGQDTPVLGAGTRSCGDWTADRQESGAAAVVDETWVDGFITAMSYSTFIDIHKGISLATDAEGMFGWLDNYCRANPTINLELAALNFWNVPGMVEVRQ